jgi:acyl carrier protein
LFNRYIFDFIVDLVNEAVGEPVEEDTDLMEAGLDSLMFVDLRNKIVEEVGVNLEVTIFFDYRTVKSLSTRVSIMIISMLMPVKSNT